MKWTRRTSIAVVVCIIVLLLLNFHCWEPGIGGRTDLIDGKRPSGTELELYFGWPACHRAELWRSDDPDLVKRLLTAAPLPVFDSDMSLVYREIGWPAIALDSVCAILVVLLVVVAMTRPNDRWTRPWIVSAVVLGLAIVVLYSLADRVQVFL